MKRLGKRLYFHLSERCIKRKTDTLSILMLEKSNFVPSYFKESRAPRRDKWDVDQDLLHKRKVCTIRLSANDSSSYEHSSAYLLTSKEVSLPFVPTVLPFAGFYTSSMRPGNSHDGVHYYSNTEIDVFHRPGVKHQAIEALMWLETDGLKNSPVDDDIPVLAIEGTLAVSPCKTEED